MILSTLPPCRGHSRQAGWGGAPFAGRLAQLDRSRPAGAQARLAPPAGRHPGAGRPEPCDPRQGAGCPRRRAFRGPAAWRSRAAGISPPRRRSSHPDALGRPPGRAAPAGLLQPAAAARLPRDPGSVHGIDGRPEGGIGTAAAARRPLNFPAEGAGDALLYGPSFLPFFFLVLFIVWGEGVGLGRHWQGPKATALFCFVLCRIAGLVSFCFVAVSPRSPAVLDGKPKCIYSQFEGPRA